MADTTTAFSADGVRMRLADDTGTLQDISGSTGKLASNFSRKIGEFNVFGGDYPIRTAGKKDASFTVTGVASTTVDEIRDLVETWHFMDDDAPRDFEVDMPDSSPGSHTLAGKVFLKSFKFEADAESEDPIMYEIEFLPSGAITRTPITA